MTPYANGLPGKLKAAQWSTYQTRKDGPRNVVEAIAAWHTVAQPKPMLEPGNIIDACNPMVVE